MAVAIVVFLAALVVVLLFLAFQLRDWGVNEARTEALLRSPETHTVAYVVPEGQDPAVLMAALARAGFTCVVDTSGGTERVLVACDEDQRGRVREVLEQVPRTNFDGAELPVGHVTFDDER